MENNPEEYATFKEKLKKFELNMELKKHDAKDVNDAIQKWVDRFPNLNIAEAELVSY